MSCKMVIGFNLIKDVNPFFSSDFLNFQLLTMFKLIRKTGTYQGEPRISTPSLVVLSLDNGVYEELSIISCFYFFSQDCLFLN